MLLQWLEGRFPIQNRTMTMKLPVPSGLPKFAKRAPLKNKVNFGLGTLDICAKGLAVMTDKLVAEDLSKFFDLIGPVGMVLVALFILSVLIILSKLFMFAQRRLSRTRSANEYLRRLGENEPEAIEVLEHSSAPLARLLLVGARLAQTETPLIRIEADMRDAATSYFQRLSRANRTLELIGIIAPIYEIATRYSRRAQHCHTGSLRIFG